MPIRRWLAALCLVALVPSSGGAQELASSFDQLRVLVKAGDRLTITDTTGQEVRGRVSRLSSSSLEVMAAEGARTLRESDIRTIRLRRSDSLANGAKWGFGVGCTFGLLGAIAVSDEVDSGAALPFFVIVYGAMGAGIGVGIDSLSHSNDVIFSRPAGATARLSIAPIAARRGGGVRLSLRF